MPQVIDAIYENGMLKPIRPLRGVSERQRVTLTISEMMVDHASILDCVGILPDEDANEMMEIIEAEFEKVDPRDWE
jgi:predicted DNA-binding antitoxin AbrB/MazE fold protein